MAGKGRGYRRTGRDSFWMYLNTKILSSVHAHWKTEMMEVRKTPICIKAGSSPFCRQSSDPKNTFTEFPGLGLSIHLETTWTLFWIKRFFTHHEENCRSRYSENEAIEWFGQYNMCFLFVSFQGFVRYLCIKYTNHCVRQRYLRFSLLVHFKRMYSKCCYQ